MLKIDLGKITTKEEFHQIIKRELDFPDYYGNNLDALHDMLGEIGEPVEIEFVEPENAQDLSEQMTKLIAGLKNLVRDISEERPNIKISWHAHDTRSGQIKRSVERPKMEFRDLKKQYQVLKADIDDAMVQVATQGNFISGVQVRELETELAEFVGVKHAVTCANGTDALSIAMMVWGIGPGDAVFVPDFTFFSSGEIVSHCGATPIFVDVDQRTFNMDAESLVRAIDKVKAEGVLNPRVIIAVDLFGLPANYPEIRDICDKYDLLLLEDGAQGFGGSIDMDGKEKRACSFGDISTTSFFPAKPLGCYGDGGALFTDNDEWADLMRSICVHGKGEMKYDNIRIGLNSRLDTIQANILKVKLKAFVDNELEDVNRVAKWYDDKLSQIGQGSDPEDKSVMTSKGRMLLPLIPENYYSSWAQYTLQFEDSETRDALKEKLNDLGIPTMVYYPKPMHMQQAFGLGEGYDYDCSATESLCERVLSLPMHPYMTEEDVDRVVAGIEQNI